MVHNRSSMLRSRIKPDESILSEDGLANDGEGAKKLTVVVR
jgi:hypothetical protein